MANNVVREAHKEIFIGEAPFSVMARVAMQLGRESISNSIVAISELVKNAYDADAEKVFIRFYGLDTDAPLLVIEDDGNGMTGQELREQWMVIGTSNKLVSARSFQKRRVLTGEKGLGRLGLDRLCKQTIVRTFSKDEERGTKLVIDWEKYEELDEKLENVKHRFYTIPKQVDDPITNTSRQINKGTQLILYGLKDDWTEDFLKRLKQELTLLVSPFAGINDFSIEIDSGRQWVDIDGKVGSEYMLQAAEWKLVSKIDENGNVSFVMSSERYNDVFKSKPATWQETLKGTGNKIPRCGPLELQVYFFPREKVTLADMSFSKVEIEEFLNANQGIRIYRDNFRVKPYGEPDGTGDWLKLSHRRVESPEGVAQRLGRWRVGYNQVVGAVFISREGNEDLIDQTNRESIVEGPAFYDLKAFAGKAIEFFELNRQKFEMSLKKETNYEKVRDKAKQSSSESANAVEKVKGLTDEIKEQVKEGRPADPKTMEYLTDAVRKMEQKVVVAHKAQQELVKVAEEQQAELKSQKDTLNNLASLGILAASFGHEVLATSNLVLINANALNRDMNAGLFMVAPSVRANIEDELKIIVYAADRIETFAEFTLHNVGRDKRTRQTVWLNQVIKQVFTSFDKFLKDDKNINVELDLPTQVPAIRAFQIDWESIFVNLITNAVWALEGIEAGRKKIRVVMKEEHNQLRIAFADSGRGLEAGTETQIFLPTISTKRNAQGEVTGTGMGLAIAKDFVESYAGGEITVESPCDLGGAQFHIKVNIPNPTMRDNGG